jgi:methyl-accepting chemotaxis protein
MLFDWWHNKALPKKVSLILTIYFSVVFAMWALTFVAHQHIFEIEAGAVFRHSGPNAKALLAEFGLTGHFKQIWMVGLMTLSAMLSIGFFPFCVWIINRSIQKPLKRILADTEQLTHGRLDLKVHVSSADDIGRIAERINDLLANMQEILLLFWNQTLICSAHLSKAEDKLSAKRYEQLRPEMDYLRHSLHDMQSVLEKCSLYDVRIENGSAVTGGFHEH